MADIILYPSDPKLQRQAGRALSNLALHAIPRAQIVQLEGHRCVG